MLQCCVAIITGFYTIYHLASHWATVYKFPILCTMLYYPHMLPMYIRVTLFFVL